MPETDATGRKKPGQEKEEKEDEGKDGMDEVDDRLYCVCRTSYDEDRVMIACDR
jgi:COMPASS component SPP1